LRKFNNLQALTINDNPFCKDESSDKSNPTPTNTYHASYQIILASLENLIYLDYRPIDNLERQRAISHHKSTNINDRSELTHKLEEANEKKEFEYKQQLKRANIEQIKDFFSTILDKINYYENGQPHLVLEKIKKIPKFDLKG
jgi:hypothetical protein